MDRRLRDGGPVTGVSTLTPNPDASSVPGPMRPAPSGDRHAAAGLRRRPLRGVRRRPPVRRSVRRRARGLPACERRRRPGGRGRAHDPEIAIVGHGIPGAAIGRRALGSGRVRREDPRQRPRVRDPTAGAVPRARAGGAGGRPRRRRPERRGAPPMRGARPRDGDRASAWSRRVSTWRRSARDPVPRRCSRSPPPWTATRRRREGDPPPSTPRSSGRWTRGTAARSTRSSNATTRTCPSPTRRRGSVGSRSRDGPIVGYLGKLIPQKGVELFLEALPALRHDAAALVVGFGSDRDWLAALVIALRRGDRRGDRVAPRRRRAAGRRRRDARGPTARTRRMGRDLHRPARPPIRAGRAGGDGRAGRALDPGGGVRDGRRRGRRGGGAPDRRPALGAGRGRRRAGDRRRAAGAVLVRAGRGCRGPAGRGDRPAAVAPGARARGAPTRRSARSWRRTGRGSGRPRVCSPPPTRCTADEPRVSRSSAPSRPPRSGQRRDHSAVASGSAGVSAPSGARTSTRSSTSNPESAEQADHVAVGETELDRALRVRPVEPMHAEMVALELLARREVLVG